MPVVFFGKSGPQPIPYRPRICPVPLLTGLFAALLGASGSFCGALAQDIADNAGTAEFQFLETLIYARPAGLAGAYTSLAQGEDAVGYNPAGLSKLESIRSISATLRRHLTDVTSGNVTYAFPGSTGVKYAFSAAYINYGRIEGLDEEGLSTGQEHVPASFNPALTASKKVSDRVRLGGTLKGVSEYLGDFEGSKLGWGLGVDAGLLYQPGVRNLGFGLSVLNVGTKVSSQWQGGSTGGMLPASLKGGFFYHPLDLPKGRVTVDIEVPWHDLPLLSGGVEYAYSSGLVLRTGSRLAWPEVKHYFLKATDQRPGEFTGGNALKLAGGFTFQGEGIGLDYAAQYWAGLSWVHALTLRYVVM